MWIHDIIYLYGTTEIRPEFNLIAIIIINITHTQAHYIYIIYIYAGQGIYDYREYIIIYVGWCTNGHIFMYLIYFMYLCADSY